MMQSEEDRQTSVVSEVLSYISEGCRTCLMLLTLGYQKAPEPTHTYSTCTKAYTVNLSAYTHTYQHAHANHFAVIWTQQ